MDINEVNKDIVRAAMEGEIMKGLSLEPEPAEIKVSVSKDGLTAEITLITQEIGKAAVSLEDLVNALEDKGVVFGVDENRLNSLAKKPILNIPVLVAEGVSPVNGIDAKIDIFIKTQRDIRPKELLDGSVDYKDLGYVQATSKGDLLCEKIPPTPGEAGTNVYGAEIPPKPGKDKPLPIGKNTVASEDGLKLYAAADGHADIANRRIQVLDKFIIQENISNATGNINYLGHVTIYGSVLTGFSVCATGNIEVNGSVEGAEIEAGGNIIITEGINGSNKGFVKANGSIHAKYIQNSNVRARGDIETTFILHSKVHSGGNITITGAKGVIVGGEISAMQKINTVFVGGRNTYVPTQIEVGNDPETLARSREIPKELESNRRDTRTILRTIQLLSEHKKAGRLTPDKLESLQRSIETYKTLTAHAEELDAELTDILETINSAGFGVLNVSGTAYPGVRLVIGSDTLLIENNYDHSSFFRNEGGITFAPLRK